MNNSCRSRVIRFLSVFIFWVLIGCSIKINPNETPSSTIPIPTPTYNPAPTASTQPILNITPEIAHTPTRVNPTSTSSIFIPTLTETPSNPEQTIPPGWIVFAGNGPVPIGIIQADGSGLRPLVKDCIFCDAVSWSPDGQWIAYVASKGYMDIVDIYKTRIDGTETEQITFGPNDKAEIAWSPIGDYIAYVEPAPYSSDICIVNIDSGDTRKLTYGIIAISPAWSPDGQAIAFLSSEDGKNNIWKLMMMDADGRNIRQIGDSYAGRGRISWSPDGDKLAFTSSGNCGEIFTINSDGSDPRKVTHTVGCASNPAWSPDGQFIAYETTPDAPPTIHRSLNIISIDGSIEKTLYSATNTQFPLRPDWAPVPALIIGNSYSITTLGSNLKLRSDPSLKGTQLTVLKEGDIVTVLDGPVDADDYFWWKLKTKDGTEGWSVEVFGWYKPVSP